MNGMSSELNFLFDIGFSFEIVDERLFFLHTVLIIAR